jgi:hypothetical protein
MQLHGRNIIGGRLSNQETVSFPAFAPATSQPLEPLFFATSVPSALRNRNTAEICRLIDGALTQDNL